MPPTRHEQVLVYVVGLAVVATAVSITAFETFMAVAIVMMAVARHPLRIPPFAAPLALFALGTLVSLAASEHIREGVPQIRKFFVYLMLFLVTSAIRNVAQIRVIFIGWSLAAAISGIRGLIQFAEKYKQAQAIGRPFYRYYVLSRITGFTDHWMTLGGQLMIALLLIGAILLFDRNRRGFAFLVAAAIPIAVALGATWTRSMWLGAFCGAVYLIWFWRPIALLAIPVLIAALLALNPLELRERALSAFSPHGNLDSNAHRAELRAIGWRMIKAHPWLGLGPEQVSRQIDNYLAGGRQPDEYYGHLENNVIQYAAERGVPTMLALMWMIAWALRDFVRGLRRLPAQAETRWVLHAAIAVTLAVMISGWYCWNLNTSYVLAIFMSVLGSGYVAASQEN